MNYLDIVVTLGSIHKTLVQPTLEYGSAAWDPYYEKDIQKPGESSEKGSAILHGQLQPLCKRDRNVAGT